MHDSEKMAAAREISAWRTALYLNLRGCFDFLQEMPEQTVSQADSEIGKPGHDSVERLLQQKGVHCFCGGYGNAEGRRRTAPHHCDIDTRSVVETKPINRTPEGPRGLPVAGCSAHSILITSRTPFIAGPPGLGCACAL